MNESADVEQICQVGMVTLYSADEGVKNSALIAECVERTYRELRAKSQDQQKILVNVTQTISTELIYGERECQLVYMVTLVGTAVDAEFVKQQQRIQQFNPAQQFNPRNGGRNN